MPLASGTRIGSFEIIAAIGAGGMGEVYRARDRRLNRDVAIKILPDLFTADPDRLARFTREAKTLAALNHPNVAHIYGLEDLSRAESTDISRAEPALSRRSSTSAAAAYAPGSGDHRCALVMELVEGVTLERFISTAVASSPRAGGLPLDEALPIARQIADALEAAHEHGIIHRDLKPANIMIRDDDSTVKVLDFGLAKTMDAGAMSGADAANSPTLSVRGTQLGIIIGTGAYMAPEQAKGKPVDKRADIWAFGVVLYEMLTGKRAFDGDDISDVLAAVLRQDIDWTALPADTPESIRRLLRRCLERDKRERLSDMSAVRAEIKDALAGGPATATHDHVHRRVDPLVVAGAIALATITGVAVWWLKPERDRPPASVIRSTEILPPDMSLQPGAESDPGRAGHVIAISPDASRVAYIANNKLFVRLLNQFDATEIPGVDEAMELFFSSDGQSLGFVAGGRLQKVALTGGAPVPLCPVEQPALGASWSGDVIVFAQPKGIYRVPANGGAPELIVTANEQERLGNPRLVPGGEKILFTRTERAKPWSEGVVAVEHLGTHARNVVIQSGVDAHYLAGGYLVYGRLNEILAIPADLSAERFGSAPVSLVYDMSVNRAAQFDISADGTLVYIPGRPRTGRLVWIGRDGVTTDVGLPAGSYQAPRVSPDGSRAAYVRVINGLPFVFVLDFARGMSRNLTRDPGQVPVWTPEGNRLAFGASRDGLPLNVHWQAADGSDAPLRLTSSRNAQVPLGFTKDGDTLLYGEMDPKNSWDLYALSLRDPPERRTPRPLATTPADERVVALSPDGRWFAYHSTEGDVSEILVRPYPDALRAIHHVAVGLWPRWASDGRIYYWWDDKIFRVQVTTSPDFAAGKPEQVASGIPSIRPGNPFDVSPDAKKLLVVKADTSPSKTEYRIVHNWIEEVKARVSSRQ